MTRDVAVDRVRVRAVLGAYDFGRLIHLAGLICDSKLLSLKFFSHFLCDRQLFCTPVSR